MLGVVPDDFGLALLAVGERDLDFFGSSTTWKFVRIWPCRSIIVPEPEPSPGVATTMPKNRS